MLSNTRTKVVFFLPRMDKNLVEEAVNGKEVTNKKEFVYGKRPTNAMAGWESGGDSRLLTKVFSNRKGDAAT